MTRERSEGLFVISQKEQRMPPRNLAFAPLGSSYSVSDDEAKRRAALTARHAELLAKETRAELVWSLLYRSLSNLARLNKTKRPHHSDRYEADADWIRKETGIAESHEKIAKPKKVKQPKAPKPSGKRGRDSDEPPAEPAKKRKKFNPKTFQTQVDRAKAKVAKLDKKIRASKTDAEHVALERERTQVVQAIEDAVDSAGDGDVDLPGQAIVNDAKAFVRREKRARDEEPGGGGKKARSESKPSGKRERDQEDEDEKQPAKEPRRGERSKKRPARLIEEIGSEEPVGKRRKTAAEAIQEADAIQHARTELGDAIRDVLTGQTGDTVEDLVKASAALKQMTVHPEVADEFKELIDTIDMEVDRRTSKRLRETDDESGPPTKKQRDEEKKHQKAFDKFLKDLNKEIKIKRERDTEEPDDSNTKRAKLGDAAGAFVEYANLLIEAYTRLDGTIDPTEKQSVLEAISDGTNLTGLNGFEQQAVDASIKQLWALAGRSVAYEDEGDFDRSLRDVESRLSVLEKQQYLSMPDLQSIAAEIKSVGETLERTDLTAAEKKRLKAIKLRCEKLLGKEKRFEDEADWHQALGVVEGYLDKYESKVSSLTRADLDSIAAVLPESMEIVNELLGRTRITSAERKRIQSIKRRFEALSKQIKKNQKKRGRDDGEEDPAANKRVKAEVDEIVEQIRKAKRSRDEEGDESAADKRVKLDENEIENILKAKRETQGRKTPAFSTAPPPAAPVVPKKRTPAFTVKPEKPEDRLSPITVSPVVPETEPFADIEIPPLERKRGRGEDEDEQPAGKKAKKSPAEPRRSTRATKAPKRLIEEAGDERKPKAKRQRAAPAEIVVAQPTAIPGEEPVDVAGTAPSKRKKPATTQQRHSTRANSGVPPERLITEIGTEPKRRRKAVPEPAAEAPVPEVPAEPRRSTRATKGKAASRLIETAGTDEPKRKRGRG